MKLLREYIRELLTEESRLGTKGVPEDIASSSADSDIEQDVVDMVKISYGPLGGFSQLEDPSSLRSAMTNYFLVDVDDDPAPDAGLLYYDAGQFNKKSSAIIHDGSVDGRIAIRDLMNQLFTTPGHWIEVSGAPEHIMINKLGLPVVEDRELAEYLVTFGFKRDVGFRWKGNGYYERDLGGRKITKIIVGAVDRSMFPGLEAE